MDFIVSLGLAFVAGVLTFFASCLVPLTPTYIAYLAGVSVDKLEAGLKVKRWQVVSQAGLFVLGFICIFLIFGFTATTVGNVFAQSRPLLQKIGGLVLVLIGLFMLQIFKPAWLIKERKVEFGTLPTRWKSLHSLLVGLAFGFAWTPCIGPMLGVILVWASTVGKQVEGISLLLAFALGLGLPFMLLALLFEKLAPVFRKSARVGYYLQLISGVVLIVMGVLMITNNIGLVSVHLPELSGLDKLTL